jgi:hypothetical protein
MAVRYKAMPYTNYIPESIALEVREWEGRRVDDDSPEFEGCGEIKGESLVELAKCIDFPMHLLPYVKYFHID